MAPYISTRTKKNMCVSIIAIAAATNVLKKGKRAKRTLWTREWLSRRNKLGCYENLLKELALEDTEGYRRWLRMTTADFEFLLEKVTPLIEKQNTVMRLAIPAAERLALTLRYLATGETQSSLAYQFRIAQNTISGILPAVCDAVYAVLKDESLKVPMTKEEWKEIASDFQNMWNFPMCIGALDGKHVKIAPPPCSGSTYFNYKGDFSIVLLALVDANLKFLYVDVGTNGRISDGGVWGKSSMKKALDSNCLDIPDAGSLHSTVKVPYVIVADDAFPLCTQIMKPYPGRCLTLEKRIFNYRLSRARRVSENAFGILAARFQVFKSPLTCGPQKAQKIVLTACALHNFLTDRSKKVYTPRGSLDYEDSVNHNIIYGDYRNAKSNFHQFKKTGSKPSHLAKDIQSRFCTYFNTVGAVPWQNEMCKLH